MKTPTEALERDLPILRISRRALVFSMHQYDGGISSRDAKQDFSFHLADLQLQDFAMRNCPLLLAVFAIATYAKAPEYDCHPDLMKTCCKSALVKEGEGILDCATCTFS